MPSTGKRKRAKLGKNKARVSEDERLKRKDSHARPGAPPKRAPDSKCQGRRANENSYCKQAAGYGTDHVGFGRCKRHGGSTPNGKKAALKLMAEMAANAYGLPIEVDPQTALLQELHRTAGHVAYLGKMVAELKEDELHGQVGTAGSSEGKTYMPKSEANILIRMYQEERKHLATIARDCVAAGIEERRVQLAEQQGEMITRVIEGVLKELGITLTPQVGKTVATQLRLVAGEPTLVPA